MSSSTLPKTPVENWEQVRDEWVAAVDKLLQDAEAWSKKQDWATRRDPKTVNEEEIGEYTVPRLLIHSIDGRLLLDPLTPFAGGGARGVVEFCVMPSYDWVRIIRDQDGWKILPEARSDELRPLTEASFVETARQLLTRKRSNARNALSEFGASSASTWQL